MVKRGAMLAIRMKAPTKIIMVVPATKKVCTLSLRLVDWWLEKTRREG
jgi:hypothetical protein